ncbi:rhamnogalacturonan acetylesterase [Sphingomonas sp. BGYR3]|uniref:rhamnogalacturonan acetylesterase n=1 Tax=Sphingomonas sp. BGYR3 TaxID=2975483 RepID=UPI0021A69C74|nr:rhamnogalacturonan acetylesterase [Sphingomonas sp. BGYR3]MDG5489763.1 rhamnogalacturonan acetylesterase [Sphingomonas sp. BGYR3]
MAQTRWQLAGNGDGQPVAPDRPYADGAGYEPASTPANRLFSVAVAEGNHRVTITARAPAQKAARLTVKAEDRRLMIDRASIAPGKAWTTSFVVNTRTPAFPPPPANAPGGSRVLLPDGDLAGFSWDDKLTLEFIGDAVVQSVTVEPADVPTLYLVGDSTVTDQRGEPGASWGQMVTAMFDNRVAVANHARSGSTLKSFATDLRLAKLLSVLKPGDTLFIQFGHNDQKQNWPQTYADPVHVYPAMLRAYIAEARARGATPVIVTSPERRSFDGGRIRQTLADHVAAAKRVAAEEQVPLIDLNTASRRIYEALGPERAPLAFSDGGRDITHHNNYGAWLMAHAVADGVRRTIPALAPHVVAPPFDADQPLLPETFGVPASASIDRRRPDGN